MPNLKPWIEAQLKRGYTKSQIKKVLVKKGYPLNAVAEVDKIGGLNNKVPDAKNIQIIILVVAIILAISMWVINTPQQKSIQADTEPVVIKEDEFYTFKTKNASYNIPKEIQGYFDMCDPFRNFTDTIGCFVAIQKTLGAYDGTIISINRTLITFPLDKTIPPANVWLIKMELDNPISMSPGELRYNIEVAVNLFNGELRPYRLIE